MKELKHEIIIIKIMVCFCKIISNLLKMCRIIIISCFFLYYCGLRDVCMLYATFYPVASINKNIWNHVKKKKPSPLQSKSVNQIAHDQSIFSQCIAHIVNRLNVIEYKCDIWAKKNSKHMTLLEFFCFDCKIESPCRIIMNKIH